MLLRTILLVGLVYVLWRLTAKVLGLPRTERLRDPAPKSTAPSPWDVLGVEPGASAERIKAAYQDKIRQYHPDRVAGLGPELQKVAEQQSKAINEAYSKLKRG
jgi:DnaJ-class molecular chaperone